MIKHVHKSGQTSDQSQASDSVRLCQHVIGTVMQVYITIERPRNDGRMWHRELCSAVKVASAASSALPIDHYLDETYVTRLVGKLILVSDDSRTSVDIKAYSVGNLFHSVLDLHAP